MIAAVQHTAAEGERILSLLRQTIRQRSSTLRQVQRAFGRRRSFIGQFLGRHKAVRVEQLLLVLRALGVDPVEFFGELYQWPGRVIPARIRPRLPRRYSAILRGQVYFEVESLLLLLRQRIAGSGLTQVEIQQPLGWGASYVSQLLSRAKALRVEQLLLILGVIEIEPRSFFAEFYLPEAIGAFRGEAGPVAGRGQEIEILRGQVQDLIRLLEEKGLVTAEEIEAARALDDGAGGEA